jgi:hypothetical protein
MNKVCAGLSQPKTPELLEQKALLLEQYLIPQALGNLPGLSYSFQTISLWVRKTSEEDYQESLPCNPSLYLQNHSHLLAFLPIYFFHRITPFFSKNIQRRP